MKLSLITILPPSQFNPIFVTSEEFVAQTPKLPSESAGGIAAPEYEQPLERVLSAGRIRSRDNSVEPSELPSFIGVEPPRSRPGTPRPLVPGASSTGPAAVANDPRSARGGDDPNQLSFHMSPARRASGVAMACQRKQVTTGGLDLGSRIGFGAGGSRVAKEFGGLDLGSRKNSGTGGLDLGSRKNSAEQIVFGGAAPVGERNKGAVVQPMKRAPTAAEMLNIDDGGSSLGAPEVLLRRGHSPGLMGGGNQHELGVASSLAARLARIHDPQFSPDEGENKFYTTRRVSQGGAGGEVPLPTAEKSAGEERMFMPSTISSGGGAGNKDDPRLVRDSSRSGSGSLVAACGSSREQAMDPCSDYSSRSRPSASSSVARSHRRRSPVEDALADENGPRLVDGDQNGGSIRMPSGEEAAVVGRVPRGRKQQSPFDSDLADQSMASDHNPYDLAKDSGVPDQRRGPPPAVPEERPWSSAALDRLPSPSPIQAPFSRQQHSGGGGLQTDGTPAASVLAGGPPGAGGIILPPRAPISGSGHGPRPAETTTSSFRVKPFDDVPVGGPRLSIDLPPENAEEQDFSTLSLAERLVSRDAGPVERAKRVSAYTEIAQILKQDGSSVKREQARDLVREHLLTTIAQESLPQLYVAALQCVIVFLKTAGGGTGANLQIVEFVNLLLEHRRIGEAKFLDCVKQIFTASHQAVAARELTQVLLASVASAKQLAGSRQIAQSVQQAAVKKRTAIAATLLASLLREKSWTECCVGIDEDFDHLVVAVVAGLSDTRDAKFREACLMCCVELQKQNCSFFVRASAGLGESTKKSLQEKAEQRASPQKSKMVLPKTRAFFAGEVGGRGGVVLGGGSNGAVGDHRPSSERVGGLQLSERQAPPAFVRGGEEFTGATGAGNEAAAPTQTFENLLGTTDTIRGAAFPAAAGTDHSEQHEPIRGTVPKATSSTALPDKIKALSIPVRTAAAHQQKRPSPRPFGTVTKATPPGTVAKATSTRLYPTANPPSTTAAAHDDVVLPDPNLAPYDLLPTLSDKHRKLDTELRKVTRWQEKKTLLNDLKNLVLNRGRAALRADPEVVRTLMPTLLQVLKSEQNHNVLSEAVHVVAELARGFFVNAGVDHHGSVDHPTPNNSASTRFFSKHGHAALKLCFDRLSDRNNWRVIELATQKILLHSVCLQRAFDVGREVGDTEKSLRIHTFFQTVFLLALFVLVCFYLTSRT